MTRAKKGEKHVCGDMCCRTCKKYVKQLDHKEPIDKSPNYLFFDIETFNDIERGHVPNLIICQSADFTVYRFPEDGQPMTGDVTNQFC